MALGANLPPASFPVAIESMPATQNPRLSSPPTTDASSSDSPASAPAKRKRAPKATKDPESTAPSSKKKKSPSNDALAPALTAALATKKKAPLPKPAGPARCKACNQVYPKAVYERIKKEEDAKKLQMKQKRAMAAEIKKQQRLAAIAATPNQNEPNEDIEAPSPDTETPVNTPVNSE